MSRRAALTFGQLISKCEADGWRFQPSAYLLPRGKHTATTYLKPLKQADDRSVLWQQKQMREPVAVKRDVDYLLGVTGGRQDKEQTR